VTNAREQRPQGPEGLLADGEEPTDSEPSIVAPEEVEATLRPVPVEAGHVAVTIPVDPRRAKGDDRELPLDLGVLRPERQDLLDRRGAQAHLVELRLGLARADHAVEVHELEHRLDDALARDGEVLPVDVVVRPVVLAVGLHLLDGLGVVDGDGVLGRLGQLQRSHHQLAEVTTVDGVRDERLEVVERPALLLDGLDDLLEGSRESAKPGNGGFIRACHLTAPLRVAYIVPTLCRRNAYHGVTGGNPQPSFAVLEKEIQQKKARVSSV
jgi:hypothetical protein